MGRGIKEGNTDSARVPRMEGAHGSCKKRRKDKKGDGCKWGGKKKVRKEGT